MFLKISCFLRILCYFQHLKNKFGVKKNFGWGCRIFYFFFGKTLLYYFILRFMLFSTLKKNWNIEKCPFTYWLNGRTVGIYIQYNPLFPCSDFWSQTCQMWGWLGGGGGRNIFLVFYAISNISITNKFWE